MSLRLHPSDLWRYGPLNLLMTAFGIAVIFLAPLLLIAGRGDFLPALASLGLGAAALFHQRQVVFAVQAFLARRAFITLSSEGLAIDGGPLDRWQLSWLEIHAMAPELATIRDSLERTLPLALCLQLRASPARRLFSLFQHPSSTGLLEVCGTFYPPSDLELEALCMLFQENVKDLQPFLVSDLD